MSENVKELWKSRPVGSVLKIMLAIFMMFCAAAIPHFNAPAIFSAVFPVVAAFLIGPLGAVVVAIGVAWPYAVLFPPYHAMFTYCIVNAIGKFVAAATLALVSYFIGRNRSRKQNFIGIICGVFDYLAVTVAFNSWSVRLVDTETSISLFPLCLCVAAAVAVHIIVFILSKQKEGRG